MTKKKSYTINESLYSFSTQLAVNLGFVSRKQISDELPFYSTDQIKRILKKLLDKAVISVCSNNGSNNSYSINGGV